MQHATNALGSEDRCCSRHVFVLVGAQLFHSVLDSILMFAGLTTGHADYGWLDWLGALGWATFGNLVGGLVLVTSIRLLRVTHRVEERRQDPRQRKGRRLLVRGAGLWPIRINYLTVTFSMALVAE